MLRLRKTKILSTPVEEILEVKAPVVEPEVQYKQMANIEFLAVEGEEGDYSYGELTDYDGSKFYYEWDIKSNRIVRLSSKNLDSLSWKLCDDVLRKYYVRLKTKTVEEPIGPKIESAINKALSPMTDAFKKMDQKIEKLNASASASKAYTTPVQQYATVQTPQTVQTSAPNQMDTPAINVADIDISENAARFYEASNTPDLGIDYMSL